MGDAAPAPEDRLLPSRRFLLAWTAAVVLVTALAWHLLPHWNWYTHSPTARVEHAVVASVVARGVQDHLTIATASGTIELDIERPSGLFAPQAAREGERVLIRHGEEGTSLGPKVRDRALLLVLAAFFVLLAVAGGPRALRTALSLVAAFVLLVVVLVPLTLRGWDPLAVTVALSAVIAAGTIFGVAGRGKKSLAAFLGTLGGLVLAVGVSAFISWQLSLTGLSVDFGQYRELGRIYWQAERLRQVDFAGLLVAGVVLSCLGAAMDVAITVATAVQEVVRNRPDISRREAIRGGLSVGRAAVWMTAATLFFVLLGAGMEPFLARGFGHGAAGWVRLMGFEEAAAAVVRIATAGLTMALVAPLTALCAGLLLARPNRTEGIRRTRGTHRTSRLCVVVVFAVVISLGLVLVDRLALRTVPDASPPNEAGFISEQALARVLAVRPPHVDHGSGRPASRGIPYSWQLVACQLVTGKFAGRTVLVNKLVHPNPDWNIVVREGELTTLELTARGPITNVNFRKPALRHRDLLCLLGVLFGALLCFGGWRSARNTLGVAAVVALIVGVLFPKLIAGWAPLPTMAGFSAIVVGGVLLLFYGWDSKALAALAGTVGALVVVVAVTAAASHGLKLYGLEGAAGRWLVELRQHGGALFNYRGLLLAGLLVAVVGVAIDTSVSIAAGIEELYRAHPTIDRRRAFASGLAIGRDVMGVCATTFVFASIGVRLPMLLLPAAAGLTPAELVNTEAGCIEVVRILACGIGLLAAAPLTTLAAVAIFSHRAGQQRPASMRARRGWRIAALAAEAAAILALAVAIVRYPPHPPQPAVRFTSLATGTFEAVVDEANTALERYDYPRAILLLWRAQERGIARADIAPRLAHLYFDYQNYVNYYEQDEQASLAPSLRPGRSADRAAGSWIVHVEAELRAAVAEEPDHFQANFELGRLLASQGRAADAAPCLERAADMEPDNVELLCDLAAAYTMAERFEKADAIAARLKQLAPDHPRVQRLLDQLRRPDEDGTRE